MRALRILAALGMGLGGLAGAGCATQAGPPLPMVLGPTTTQAEGWLSARGELMLFPSRSMAGYDPYAEDETKKCISLVDATGQGRATFAALERRRVVATGVAVAYGALADGTGPGDRLLGRKYHGDEIVQNFCLRPYVFVASRIEPVK